MSSSSTPPQPIPSGSTLISTKHASPPRTPPNIDAGTSSSDCSPIDELSFDFTFDADGQYVRLAKSVYSSPPTPQDDEQEVGDEPAQKPPSPEPPAPRANAARSESSNRTERPSIATSSLGASSRQAQRVTSAQIASTPAASSSAAPLRQTYSMTAVGSRRNDRPQRVTLEEAAEREERFRRQVEEMQAKMEDEMRRARMEERENKANKGEGASASGHQWHAAEFEPPPHNSSRSLSGSIAPTSSSLLSSTRGGRGYSNMGSICSRQVAESDLGSSSQRERERDRASLRPIAPGPNRAGRVLQSSVSSKYNSGAIASAAWDNLPEAGAEGDYGYGHGESQNEWGHSNWGGDEIDPAVEDQYDQYQPVSSNRGGPTARQRSQSGISTSQSGRARPRRSASFGDASTQEDRVSPANVYPPQNGLHSVARPGTSLGLHSHRGATDGTSASTPRRSWEGKGRAQRDDAVQDERYQWDYEAVERREILRQSPSPPQSNKNQRSVAYGLKRHDSDTVRGGQSHPHQQSPPSTPPQAEAIPARLSPSAKNVTGSSSTLVNGSSLNASRNKHRRSPTAPELGMAGGTLVTSQSARGKGKSWTAVAPEKDVFAGGDEYAMSAGAGNASAQSQPLRTSRKAPAAPSAQNTKNQLMVNKRAFIRLDVLGKGGSSRVYRVMNAANEIFAIKRVSLEKTDAETMNGYMNEIALLKRLDGNNRIIRLYDSELKSGPGGTKGHLLLLMECGEIDMAKLLLEQQKEPLNMVWVSYYWQQMLQAVHVIHEEKIVHSDLKPANFVLVRGQLKLIDFGIANAIANDTTNIQRESAIGTVNYMSPETIELPDGMRRLKVGRPSDVWSLGCILYQMVYGQPPFHHLSFYQKMKAIPDPNHILDFPKYATPSIPASQGAPQKLEHLAKRVRADVIEGMKSCLGRNPKERCTIPELLEQKWLAFEQREFVLTDAPGRFSAAPPGTRRIKELLTEEETVINHHYMAQLLDYGMKLGINRGAVMSQEELKVAAEGLVRELRLLDSN